MRPLGRDRPQVGSRTTSGQHNLGNGIAPPRTFSYQQGTTFPRVQLAASQRPMTAGGSECLRGGWLVSGNGMWSLSPSQWE